MKDKKVLIIDDDQDIQHYLKNFFELQGSEVCGCATLIDCVENLETFRPDLILLDLNLEFESGVDFLKFRESMPALTKVPIVIISSHSETDLIRECMSHGIKDFIKKPFESFEQIESRLKKIIP